jgi:hypothetical protein
MLPNTFIKLVLAVVLAVGSAAYGQTPTKINLANQVKGNLLIGNNTRCAADTIIHGLGTGTNPECASLPMCADSSHALAYSTTTHAFSCQEITGSLPRLDQVLDPTANKTFDVTDKMVVVLGDYTEGPSWGFAVKAVEGWAWTMMPFMAYNAAADPPLGTLGSFVVWGNYSDAGVVSDNYFSVDVPGSPTGNYAFILEGGTNKARFDGNIEIGALTGNGKEGTLTHANTAARTWTFPDSSGTVALEDANVKRRAFGYAFGATDAASALTAGGIGYFTVPYGCAISAWHIAVDGGTATFDILRIATGGTSVPTASLVTAGGGTKPAISSGTLVHSTTVANWGTTITKDDTLGIKLDTVATAKFASLTVECDQ